ncbi:4-(cytidine 5'-diphospho)-2-C-methyl-D-erythritol kinase [Ferruginibacter sp.]
MVVFPNCKLNLGLRILNKREDGFHNLETVFYPIALKDALEIIAAPNNKDAVAFSSSGLTVEGNVEDNICIKAFHLIKKDFPGLPSIKMHLHKAIPMGAGLGGGSADAAFTLQLLNNKFDLGIDDAQLIHYAAQLGSDCAFFMLNKPCYATGRGEIMEAINVDLSAYKIILINPGIHVNTGWAFSQLESERFKRSEPYLRNIIQQSLSTWKDTLLNDFEIPVFEKYPAIKKIKEDLYNRGAIYAAMSGSGSTVFGIFEKHALIDYPQKETFVKILS